MFFVRFISTPSISMERKQKLVPEGTVSHTRDRIPHSIWRFGAADGEMCEV
jgi:hypothetical protein